MVLSQVNFLVMSISSASYVHHYIKHKIKVHCQEHLSESTRD